MFPVAGKLESPGHLFMHFPLNSQPRGPRETLSPGEKPLIKGVSSLPQMMGALTFRKSFAFG